MTSDNSSGSGVVGSTAAFQAAGSGSSPTLPLQFLKSEWRVRDCSLRDAQQLVARHHYAKGGSNTRTFSHGLYYLNQYLCGVAWWLPPTKNAAVASFDGDWKQVLSLSRLVLVPDVPKNAASFLIRHSIRFISRDGRFKCLVTYADDYQKHIGTIYFASGWEYVGKTTAERTYVDENGRMIARKAGPKTRTHSEMVALGYRVLGRFFKHKFRILL